jgi:hypothetical protein
MTTPLLRGRPDVQAEQSRHLVCDDDGDTVLAAGERQVGAEVAQGSDTQDVGEPK